MNDEGYKNPLHFKALGSAVGELAEAVEGDTVASSYARKYALNGLFAIDDTKDADTDENHFETGARTKKPQCPEDVWHKLVKMEVEGLRTNSGLSPLQFLASKYKVDDLTLVKFNNDVQMARDSNHRRPITS